MAENDIGDWFRSIPLISKWWFSLSIVFPLLGRIGLLNPFYMILDFALVVYHFQVSSFIVVHISLIIANSLSLSINTTS